MHISNVSEAQAHLSQLIQRALAGDEVLIAKTDRPLVRLMPSELDTTPRMGGFWAGKMTMPSDAEWKEMDHDIESLCDQSTLFPGENA